MARKKQVKATETDEQESPGVGEVAGETEPETQDTAGGSDEGDGAAPPDESKEDKFRRIGTKRLKAALIKIQLLENLSGSGYAYTPEQVEKVTGTLQTAIDSVKATLSARFNKGAVAKGPDIQL